MKNKDQKQFDVLIIGGSYSGLAASAVFDLAAQENTQLLKKLHIEDYSNTITFFLFRSGIN